MEEYLRNIMWIKDCFTGLTLIRNGNCASVLPLSSLDSFPSDAKVKMSDSKLCSDFGKSETVVNTAIIILISAARD